MNVDDAVGKEQLSKGESEEDALNVDIDSFIAMLNNKCLQSFKKKI